MPQLEFTPTSYIEQNQGSGSGQLVLKTKNGETDFDFSFETIRSNTFRATFSSQTHPLPPHPSIERRHPQISPKEVRTSGNDHSRTFTTGDVTATIEWIETPVISLGWEGSREKLHSDLPHRSYVVDGDGVAHYMRHDRKALHVGLGEAAAPMDLTARSFKIDATDCFGYEVYKTDPMYKHMPLLVKATPQGCVAIVSSSYSRGYWSVGAEIDGLWGHFKVYRQDYGGLEEYLIVGRTLKDVVRSYAELVGFPLLAPRWAYGYLSGGYKYTMGDDPPAYKQLLNFAEKLEEHDIPCSGHQMSSGYSIAESEPKVRNVFTWNKHRFPDVENWTAKYHARGIRLMTNIKPFVLASHPCYQDLVSANGLFTDPRTNETGFVRLWSAGGGESDLGGHIDFTSPGAYQWWRRNVGVLKKQGIDAMWNDNNEYTLPNDMWKMSLKGNSTNAPNKVGLWGRAMQTELMAKASYEGLLDAEPNQRPFVLTRSAGIGTLRYCCSSWSGDNMTSWEGMKGANALSLTAGISLMHQYGHDIGGFEGPQPSPELLLRWVQISIYGPRFAINCFKTSPQDNTNGEVIEPWMYPEITPLVRKAIKRRYEVMPYIYSLGIESHLYASPPQRWIGWGYESDPEVWTGRLKRGEEQYWFGDTLLIGGVYEPGVAQAEMYLPRKHDDKFDFGFVNLNAPYEYLASGQWVTISSPWKEHTPVLAKVGGAIPVGKSVQTRMPGDVGSTYEKNVQEDDYRGIEIFPPKGSSHGTVFINSWYDDDGLSLRPEISKFTIEYSSTRERIVVKMSSRQGDKFLPAWEEIDIILPHGDRRYVVSDTADAVEKLDDDELGRTRYRIPHRSIRVEEQQTSNGYH